jgi:hypothetical protein
MSGSIGVRPVHKSYPRIVWRRSKFRMKFQRIVSATACGWGRWVLGVGDPGNPRNQKFSNNHTLEGSVVAAKKARRCPSGDGTPAQNFTGPFSETVSIVPLRCTLKRAQASVRRGFTTLLDAPTQRLLPSAAQSTPPISPQPGTNKTFCVSLPMDNMRMLGTRPGHRIKTEEPLLVRFAWGVNAQCGGKTSALLIPYPRTLKDDLRCTS